MAQLLKNADNIIAVNILEGVRFLGDYAFPFWVGEAIDGSPLSGVFLMNNAYWGDFENLEEVSKGMDLQSDPAKFLYINWQRQHQGVGMQK